MTSYRPLYGCTLMPLKEILEGLCTLASTFRTKFAFYVTFAFKRVAYNRGMSRFLGCKTGMASSVNKYALYVLHSL
jgi:hypothetical protein